MRRVSVNHKMSLCCAVLCCNKQQLSNECPPKIQNLVIDVVSLLLDGVVDELRSCSQSSLSSSRTSLTYFWCRRRVSSLSSLSTAETSLTHTYNLRHAQAIWSLWIPAVSKCRMAPDDEETTIRIHLHQPNER